MTVRELIVRIGFSVDNVSGANTTVERMKSRLASTGATGASAGALASNGMAQIASSAQRASQKVSDIGTSATKAGAKTSSMADAIVGKLNAMAAAAAAYFAVDKVVQTADEMMNLDGRLRTITQTEEERYGVEDKLYGLAQQNRQSYSSMGDLYFKVARAAQRYGISAEDSARVTDVVSKSLTVGGASASEASATILQLGQALSSGVLQGDELHSLDENASLLMQHIADYFGVSMGDLKEMGRDGALTSEMVIQAIIASGEAVDQEFSHMPVTIGQAMQTSANAFDHLIQTIERRTNIFGVIGQTIADVVGVIDTFIDAASSFDFMGFIMGNQALFTMYNTFMMIYQMVESLASLVMENLAGSFSWLGEVWQMIEPLVDMGLYNIMAAVGDLKNAWDNFLEAVQVLEPLFMAIWQVLTGVLGVAFSALFALATLGFRGIAEVINIVISTISTLIGWIKDAYNWFSNLFSSAQKFVGMKGDLDATAASAESANTAINNVQQTNNINVNSPQEVAPAVAGLSDSVPYP